MRLDNDDQASVLTKAGQRVRVGLLPTETCGNRKTQEAASDQLRGQKDIMGQRTTNTLCTSACAHVHANVCNVFVLTWVYKCIVYMCISHAS